MNIVLFEGECRFPRADERYTHIRKVLKKGQGDSFLAGLVNGSEGTAVITSVDDKGLSFEFRPERQMRPLYPLSVIVGFPRPIQLKRLLRDLASLGVSSICLAETELGEKSYRESSLVSRGAARAALIDGCMQAGGTAVPVLAMSASVADAIRRVCAPGTVPVLLDTVRADSTLIGADFGRVCAERPLALAIGSERGWTDAERARFREAGFMVCSMGSRILRTETAATAAVAIALAKAGFMDGV